MHRRIIMLVAIAGFVTACAGDQSITGQLGESAKGASIAGGGTSDSTQQSAPQTSNGPVASVRVFTKQLSIPVGRSAVIGATAIDAGGVRVAGKKLTWSTSDAAVVAVSDTGVVTGKALGSAKVYASVDGFTDSATVTVVASVDNGNPAPARGVASFDLTAQVRGAIAGADTSQSQALGGATVKLTRVGGVGGDTLQVGIDAGTATSNADGVVTFKGLTGGVYSVEITPATGSGYAVLKTGFGPPMTSDVKVTFVLRK